MSPRKKLTRKDYEHFNDNCRRMSDDERRAFLYRVAQERVHEPVPPHVLPDLTKWLGRQMRGHRPPLRAISTDAAAIIHLAVRARHAIAFMRPAETYFSAAERILARYNSKVIRQADPFGMTIGVHFIGSEYGAGRIDMFGNPRNVFYVA